MPTLLTRDEIVIELGMLMHDDGVMGDGEASNNVIAHPSDGQSTNVVSSSSKHHAGRGVLAVERPTMMMMMSSTLLVNDRDAIEWSRSAHDDSAMSDGRSLHDIEIMPSEGSSACVESPSIVHRRGRA